MTIRISTTWLESFRRVVETEYGNEAELVAQIRGEPFKPSWQMNAGRAWHHLLATPRSQMCEHKKSRANYYALESQALLVARANAADGVRAFRCDDCCCWHVGKPARLGHDLYYFDDEAVSEAKAHIGPGAWEVKTTKDVMTCHGWATIVAQADHIHGLMIQDNKTKFSPVDEKDYEPSLQWRCYLWAHEATVFRYNCFAFKDPREGYCELMRIESFRFWPYAGIEEDVQRWANEFVLWADTRNLMGFLDRAGKPEGVTP